MITKSNLPFSTISMKWKTENSVSTNNEIIRKFAKNTINMSMHSHSSAFSTTQRLFWQFKKSTNRKWMHFTVAAIELNISVKKTEREQKSDSNDYFIDVIISYVFRLMITSSLILNWNIQMWISRTLHFVIKYEISNAKVTNQVIKLLKWFTFASHSRSILLRRWFFSTNEIWKFSSFSWSCLFFPGMCFYVHIAFIEIYVKIAIII